MIRVDIYDPEFEEDAQLRSMIRKIIVRILRNTTDLSAIHHDFLLPQHRISYAAIR